MRREAEAEEARRVSPCPRSSLSPPVRLSRSVDQSVVAPSVACRGRRDSAQGGRCASTWLLLRRERTHSQPPRAVAAWRRNTLQLFGSRTCFCHERPLLMSGTVGRSARGAASSDHKSQFSFCVASTPGQKRRAEVCLLFSSPLLSCKKSVRNPRRREEDPHPRTGRTAPVQPRYSHTTV